MAKKSINETVMKIKKAMDEEKLIIGKAEVVKGIRKNTINTIFLANNITASTKEDISHIALPSSRAK